MREFPALLGKFVKEHTLNKNSFIRLLGALGVSALSGLVVIYYNNDTYWNVTINRVQTVDFNILANILPSKLSKQLLNDDKKGLQATLDSNYGLFGMVVTDCKSADTNCPQQKIIYASKSRIKTSANGKQKLEPQQGKYPPSWAEKLVQTDYPAQELTGDFLILRDPPPLKQEWKFQSPRVPTKILTGEQNTGNIIGRVYLLRGKQPAFHSELGLWLQNPLNDSSKNFIYKAITGSAIFTGFIVWLLAELTSYIKINADRQELEAEKKVSKAAQLELAAEKKASEATQKELAAEKKASEATQTKLEAEQQISQAAQMKLEAEQKIRQATQRELEAERKIRQATQMELEAEEKISQATEQLFLANQAAGEYRDLANKAKEYAESVRDLESKTQQEKIDAQNKAVEAERLAIEAEAKARVIESERQQLIQEKQQLDTDTKKLEIDRQHIAQERQQLEIDRQDIIDLIERDNNGIIESLRNKNNELEQEIISLQRSLDNHLNQEINVSRNADEELQYNIDEQSDLHANKSKRFSNAYDALMFAEKIFPILDIFDSAKESSISENGGLHYDSDRVFRDLSILAHVGSDYFKEPLGNSIHTILRQNGVDSSGESSTIRNQEGARRFEGVDMYDHLKFGRRLRIHFYLDETTRKIKIGYCGKHL